MQKSNIVRPEQLLLDISPKTVEGVAWREKTPTQDDLYTKMCFVKNAIWFRSETFARLPRSNTLLRRSLFVIGLKHPRGRRNRRDLLS